MLCEVSHQPQLRERLSDLALRLPEDPDPVRKRLADLLVADPPAFRGAALEILPGLGETSARRCVLDLMLKAGLLPLCDPALIGLESELALTQELFELDPQLDMKMARRLSAGPGEKVPEEVVQRVLMLLNSIPENARVMPIVIKLLRHSSPSVRSKAALVIGRVSKTPQVMQEFLSEADPRVRANAIEALWGMDSAKARAVLREAADDPHNRVAGNALLGLYRVGDTSAIPRILQMAAHPKPEFRTTAAWVMEQTGSPRFLPALAQMVRETNPGARGWVFRAITKLKRIASGTAGLARLRVHLAGGSLASGGSRTVRAAIAGQDGRELAILPATAIVLWEDSRLVADYSVRPLERPASLGLGLVLPLGEAGDEALAALTPLKRVQDRWQECRYVDANLPGALEQAFAFLETVSESRHLILVAPPRNGSAEAAPWEPVLARARGSSVSVQIVPDSGSVATASERAYLMLMCGYEIAGQLNGNAAEPAELKLEVYTGRGYGLDVLKMDVLKPGA